jgi:hypothetical protein
MFRPLVYYIIPHYNSQNQNQRKRGSNRPRFLFCRAVEVPRAKSYCFSIMTPSAYPKIPDITQMGIVTEYGE